MKEKKNKTVKEKEIYRLWWEYLKRSEDYKKFCDWMPKWKEDKDTSDKTHSACRRLGIRHPNDEIGLMYDRVSQTVYQALDQYDDPVIKRLDKSKKLDSFTELFSVFGNVHSDSFENWWERQGQHLKDIHDKYIGRNFDTGLISIGFKRPVCGVEDYREFIKRDINWCISKFRFKNEREPTCEELGDSLLERISSHEGYVYLVVDVVDKSLEDLGKQFMEIVKKHKQDTSIKQLKEDHRKYFVPICNTIHKDNYIRTKEIKRYLKVYDLKKARWKMAKIIQNISPSSNHKEVNVQRAFYQDKKRAEKIIKNVEQGVFPGEYQPSRQKRLKEID